MDTPRYNRVILKISGEALAGSKGSGIDQDILMSIATQIRDAAALGTQIGVVVGAGNIWRGRMGPKMDRATADHMGMLATTINALALQDALEQLEVQTRVQTAVEMRAFAEPYIRRKAMRHLEKGRVVIFACGTGNPYFTTDTTAALRGAEIEADIIFKATNVDGIYTADPRKDTEARRYKSIAYMDVLKDELKVMDATAISLCMDNRIPVLVFDLATYGNIERAVRGEAVGTLVSPDVETALY